MLTRYIVTNQQNDRSKEMESPTLGHNRL